MHALQMAYGRPAARNKREKTRSGGEGRKRVASLVTSTVRSSTRNQWEAANARRSCDSAPRKWRRSRVAWSCRLLPCVLRRLATARVPQQETSAAAALSTAGSLLSSSSASGGRRWRGS